MHISSVLASFKLLKHLDLAYDVLGDYCEVDSSLFPMTTSCYNRRENIVIFDDVQTATM
jgi:hypothetical protein